MGKNAGTSHAHFLNKLHENGVASMPPLRRLNRIKRIEEEIEASGQPCHDETIFDILMFLSEDDLPEVRLGVARLIPHLPCNIGLQIECKLDEDSDDSVLVALRAARRERLKNGCDASILRKCIEMLASCTATRRDVDEPEMATMFERLYSLLKRAKNLLILVLAEQACGTQPRSSKIATRNG